MYPEDRVLIAYVPNLDDFATIEREGWYRIPLRSAPKGLYAEYFAFYFGRKFGERKWSIHYYARQKGYELVTRLDLFPDQQDHPRAGDLYYRVQLGPLQQLEQPIVSLRWRRIAFAHTTWDRFQDAREINDLFIEGGPYVDRLYAALKDQGLPAERNYRINESGIDYIVPLMIPCQHGQVTVTAEQIPVRGEDVKSVADQVAEQVATKGGIRTDAGCLDG
jgi:hypothetical protein